MVRLPKYENHVTPCHILYICDPSLFFHLLIVVVQESSTRPNRVSCIQWRLHFEQKYCNYSRFYRTASKKKSREVSSTLSVLQTYVLQSCFLFSGHITLGTKFLIFVYWCRMTGKKTLGVLGERVKMVTWSVLGSRHWSI